jgi:hypothetical protein
MTNISAIRGIGSVKRACHFPFEGVSDGKPSNLGSKTGILEGGLVCRLVCRIVCCIRGRIMCCLMLTNKVV